MVWDDIFKTRDVQRSRGDGANIKIEPSYRQDAVKSILQNIQLCRSFLKPKGGKTYPDVTLLLKHLTSKSFRFK